MNLTELLPPGKDGKHEFLPWQLEALKSQAKYLGLVGGVGSGKNIVASVIGVALSIQVPGNRGIILRKTYNELHESTELTFLQTLERAEIGGLRYLETHHHYPHRVVLPNESEIFFRETKNPGRYLGPEYGWFILDEASLEDVDVVQGLMRRLRLPQAGKYLKGMFLTNPPDKRSWYARMFPTPGIREVKEPVTGEVTKYHTIRSTTRQNKHLPPSYLADLLTTNPNSEISRVIDGHYGYTQEGVPVFPQFNIFTHVRDDGFQPRTPIIRGWDFGFHHPACTWNQLWRCSHRRLHWSVIHELDGEKLWGIDFLTSGMVETAVCFPDTSRFLILDCGDRSGAQVSDKGPGPIIRAAGSPWHMNIKYKTCPIEPGLELIRKYLSFRCPCGLPGMIVDSTCVSVIEGLQGGYHYPQNYRGTKEEVPKKDRFYDDFMDTIRYVGENFVRMEELGSGFLDQLMADEAGVRAITQGNEAAWLTEGVSW